MMSFANLDKLIYIIPPTVFITVLLFFYAWWRRFSLKNIFRKRVPEYLYAEKLRVTAKEILLIFAVIIFALTLLRPQWGSIYRPVTQEGTDFLILLDVSRSMDAKDVSPTRLERSKNIIRILSESLRGDRAALMLFAGEPFLMVPFTSDMGAFNMFVDSVSTESVRFQGTDLGSALMKANEVFEKRNMSNRIILLITDGEDHEGRVIDAARLLRDNDVTVYTVGIGTDNAVIPVTDSQGREALLRDRHGEIVRTSVDLKTLQQISAITGGKLLDLNRSYSELSVIRRHLSEHSDKTKTTTMVSEPIERYQWFVLLLIIVLTGELFILKYGRNNE